MDRLPSVALRRASAFAMLVGLSACKGEGDAEADEPKTRRRVDAVQAAAQPKTDLEGFCDERAAAGEAKPFTAPPLAEGTMPDADGWRWVNVWATWCKPCIEEMPLLEGWKGKFAKDNLPLDVVFLSVDDTADEVSSFRAKHPEIPESVRIRDRETELGPWLATMGLADSTALPIHVFVDPDDKIRCIRLGQINERDYANVAALVREG